ncbi:hypothetical protein [Streptacidiphilus monticola]|uniref:Uncharacterized protein n=1 Tax=Streptacidiphilus monticola TaxID=2161674 RepID=A0ABW1G1Z4_9ACTN
MSALSRLLKDLYQGEAELERQLHEVAERHRTEHEVHHVALDVSRWCRRHRELLAHTAPGYGADLPAAESEETPGPLAALREKAAEALGRRPEPGLLLLHDLTELHLAAARNSLHWEMLAQAGQAMKEQPLLELASRCHPETLRQMRWTNTLVKILSPQVLTST